MNLTPPPSPIARVLDWGGEGETYESSQWEEFPEEEDPCDPPEPMDVTFITWIRSETGQWVRRPVNYDTDPGTTVGVSGIQALWRGYSLRKTIKKVYTASYLQLLMRPIQGIKRKRWERDIWN